MNLIEVPTPKRQRPFAEINFSSPKRPCFDTCSREAGISYNFDHQEGHLQHKETARVHASPFKKRPFDPVADLPGQMFPEQRKKLKPLSFQDSPGPEEQSKFRTDFTVFGITEEHLLSWIPKHLRSKHQASAKDAKIYSPNDLRLILAAVIEDTKKIVKNDFESVLQARLSEQQQNFAQYSDDYLGRHHREKPAAMDYIS